jgi:hypothetical protein
MRNTFIILTTIFSYFTIHAQTSIEDIDNGIDFPSGVQGVYYKDIQGFMAPFEGIWLYTNGNTSFKMVLTKHEMQYTGKYYLDYIDGEYEYIENGNTIRSTLNNTDPSNRGISEGKSLIKSHKKPLCNDCPANERRIGALIEDFDRDLGGRLTLKLITVNGLPAIEAYIYGFSTYNFETDTQSPYDGMELPSGYITLIKQ